MSADWPRVGLEPVVHARMRSSPEDFVVREQLGFSPSGDGEHVFLQLEKRGLNTLELVQRLASLSNIPARDIGYSGLKDRNAITSQWFSVRLAGRQEPVWQVLAEGGEVQILQVSRHARKLKRGVHRGNAFCITLRQLRGSRPELEAALQRIAQQGAPNYFGAQRFGRRGSTLRQARQWVASGRFAMSRARRSLYLSALRGHLFNTLLAQRVLAGTWNRVLPGDVCMLQGSRSHFPCAQVDSAIEQRAVVGDIHPGLPLWGKGPMLEGTELQAAQQDHLADEISLCAWLERAGVVRSYRAARVLADDFCWQFCDDGSLRLEFALGAGSYATAVLAELANCEEGDEGSAGGGE